MKKHLITLSLVSGIAILSTACTPNIHTRGNLVPESKIEKVDLNTTSQFEISELFGPPTIIAPFNDDTGAATWYYAGHVTEQMGVFKHEVTERKILKVDFDDLGRVSAIENIDPNDARDIEFVSRKTKTAGKEFTALQQLVGNVGKFNSISQVQSQVGNN